MKDFELSPEIIDEILYAMENQNDDFMFDTEKQCVSSESADYGPKEKSNPENLVEIPQWNSSDGFILMEKFTGTLRNPIIRENLRGILSGGRGVFRNFKAELKKHAELERLWYNFKEREMKARINVWFNDLREIWGLERIGIEVNETDELILSDFEICEGCRGMDEQLKQLDRQAFREIFASYPGMLADYYYNKIRSEDELCTPLPHLIYSAFAPEGSLAGFAWFRQLDLDPQPGDERKQPSTVFDLLQLYIVSEYRGLGLASLLLDKTADFAYSREADWLLMNLFLHNKGLEDCLYSKGFEPAGTAFKLNVQDWGRWGTD